DQVLFMPMTSGLSGTCNNAKVFAEEEYNGKVFVVDNKRISVNLKESVFEAVKLLNDGKTAQEVKDYLEQTSSKHSIYITVSVLKYLKKGGRISPAAAALGAMLNFKPILFSRGDNFEKFGIVMSMAQAKKKMLQKVKEEFETIFAEEYNAGKMKVAVAHTQNEQEALKFAEEIKAVLPKAKLEFVDPLSLSVSCHIGPGALAISSFISCND
ncbi:MAG: DegV family EDD domain-containing protein, partial [Clostridia bacterium]|nr:DegV family EDD domain-containing protein [Clostridia bacterium]